MGMYRVEWDCCGSVTETDGYLPERCPICERDALRRERDELAARPAEIERITEAGRAHIRRAAAFEAQRDELAARLAKIEAQKPVAWLEHELQGTGLRHLHFARRPNTLRDDVVAPVWTELIARPAPAQHVSAADELALAASPDEAPMRCAECGQLGWHKLGCSHVAHERGARLMARLAPAQAQPRACRDDGRCQYAIDHGAEGLGHCPPGMCVMPCEGGAA